MSFKSKICQTDVEISITNQFQDFLNLIFGGVLLFGPTAAKKQLRGKTEASSASGSASGLGTTTRL